MNRSRADLKFDFKARRALLARVRAAEGFTPAERLVLTALADRINARTGFVAVAHATLAADTGLCDRTVRRALAKACPGLFWRRRWRGAGGCYVYGPAPDSLSALARRDFPDMRAQVSAPPDSTVREKRTDASDNRFKSNKEGAKAVLKTLDHQRAAARLGMAAAALGKEIDPESVIAAFVEHHLAEPDAPLTGTRIAAAFLAFLREAYGIDSLPPSQDRDRSLR